MNASHLIKNNAAIVALTRLCNCRCSACDMWKSNDTIDIKNFSALGLDRLNKSSFGVVQYTGGEVTLLKELLPLIETSKEKGFAVHIVTNGTTMTENLARGLDKSGINFVSISVDHYDNKTSSKYRGFPNINLRVKNSVRLLRDRGIPMSSSTLIARHNYKDIEKTVEFVNSDLGISFSFCVPEVSENFLLGSKMKALTRNNLVEIFEKILDMKRSGYMIINNAAYIKDLIRWLSGKGVRYLCKAGKNIVYIDWNMNVYPCFIKSKICSLEELEKTRLMDIKCNECNFQCFREPSLFYCSRGKIELMRSLPYLWPAVMK